MSESILEGQIGSTNNEIVRDLALAATEIVAEVELPNGETIPAHFVHKDMVEVDKTDQMTAPMNITEAQAFGTVESLIEYIACFGKTPFIIGKPRQDGELFRVILDYHTQEQPSHCRHIAALLVSNSAQWATWTNAAGERFSQRKFKEFIEDNIEDVTEPDSATILQQIAEVKVESKQDTSTKVDNQGDSVKQDASLKLATDAPQPLTLALKPWKCMSTHMEITARIYAHVNANGRVEFSYQLINADAAIEQKFNDYREQIAKETKQTVYV